jgi:small subunit ribosomal protein S6
MRRYELMLVLKPDVPDERTQAVIDRITRGIVTAGGSILKVSPWGRRRLAYAIGHHREGSYHIVLFESPAEAISELEHSLLITEEVLRHLVTRDDRPVKASRRDGAADDADLDIDAGPPADDEEDEGDTELIDESESEAAPAAID